MPIRTDPGLNAFDEAMTVTFQVGLNGACACHLKSNFLSGQTMNPEDIRRNHQRWMALAREGNPLRILNRIKFAQPVTGKRRHLFLDVPADPPRTPLNRGKRFYAFGDRFQAIAYAAADARSPLRGREDLVETALIAADRLVNALDRDGCWAPKHTADPNTNRFVLFRALDGIRTLRTLPQGETAWTRWREKLGVAVDLQRRAYAGDPELIAWDYAAAIGGDYVNVDAAYMLDMALSSELFQRRADLRAARKMMKKIATRLLPDGAFHYINRQNETPRYHTADLLFIGRYYTLTGDPLAKATLEKTKNFYPLSISAEAIPELWSSPWWKQHWDKQIGCPQDPAGLMIVAYFTKDPLNTWLLWRSLERIDPFTREQLGASTTLHDVTAADYWPGLDGKATPLPESFFRIDRNIRGFRTRSGPFYFGLTQGTGQRNTFVGGLATALAAVNRPAAAFRGVQMHVHTPGDGKNGIWLSGMDDITAATWNRTTAAALAVRYTLQPERWVTPRDLTPTPWQVTQVWSIGRDHAIGFLALRAREPAQACAIVGRIPLGPDRIEQQDASTFTCGPLKVRLLKAFSAAGVVNWQAEGASGWPCLELKYPAPPGAVSPDETFLLAAWIGPKDNAPPDTFALFPDSRGWRARWSDGSARAVTFDPDKKRISLRDKPAQECSSNVSVE